MSFSWSRGDVQVLVSTAEVVSAEPVPFVEITVVKVASLSVSAAVWVVVSRKIVVTSVSVMVIPPTVLSMLVVAPTSVGSNGASVVNVSCIKEVVLELNQGMVIVLSVRKKGTLASEVGSTTSTLSVAGDPSASEVDDASV
jgi:hypothetical protein